LYAKKYISLRDDIIKNRAVTFLWKGLLVAACDPCCRKQSFVYHIDISFDILFEFCFKSLTRRRDMSGRRASTIEQSSRSAVLYDKENNETKIVNDKFYTTASYSIPCQKRNANDTLTFLRPKKSLKKKINILSVNYCSRLYAYQI